MHASSGACHRAAAPHPRLGATLKPPAIDYVSPGSVSEVIELLARHGAEARIISGGQSLMPMLAFRLAAPELLVDLRRVPGLDRIEIDEVGVRLGARVRWRDLEHDARIAQAQPLVAAALPHVAHYQIRSRGTIGGSLAHADPAAELPAVALCCEAEIVATGPAGERVIAAEDFFTGALATALEPTEMIVAARFPAWPAGRRWGFREFARRRGDFALAGVALHYDEDGTDRVVASARIAAFGVGETPLRLRRAEEALHGRSAIEAIDDAVAAALESIEPPSDLHADGRYRRALVGTLLARALEDASARSR